VKFDNILVSGCSWCEHPYDYEGGERSRKTDAKPYSIKDVQNRAFGKLLSDKFNTDYKNLATAGNSNDIIFYNVWKYIQQNQLNNSLVIIGLTEITRFFVHHKKKRKILKPGAPKRYSDLFNISEKDLKKYHEIKYSLTKNINYEPRNYFYDGFETWAEYIESYDDEYIFNRHPNSYDHKILANNLYEHLNG
jgi:hypothetical protein